MRQRQQTHHDTRDMDCTAAMCLAMDAAYNTFGRFRRVARGFVVLPPSLTPARLHRRA